MPRIPRINPAANSATTRAFVQWIRSAAPYIHAFRGKTFVIAFGGEVVADETFLGIVHDLNLLQSLGIRLVVVHGSQAADRSHPQAAEHPQHVQPRTARDRRRDAGLRARGNRPCAQPHRGAALARRRQLADGRRAHSRRRRQLPDGEADRRARRRRHAMDRRSPPRRRVGDSAAARRRRHRAGFAARILAYRGDLQPRAGRGRHPGRRPPVGAQADLPDGNRWRSQRPPPAAERAFDARRRGAARQRTQAAGRRAALSARCDPRLRKRRQARASDLPPS